MEQGRQPVADGGGAAPTVRGGGERVWELHYGGRNHAAGSIWGEEGRRRGLRVELGGGGDHGVVAGVLAQGEARLWGKGSGVGGRGGFAVKEK
jgi:hypothetical protein